MKGKILIAAIAVWLPAAGVHAGYREMMNNLKGYRPPEYFQRQLQESGGKLPAEIDARDEDMGRTPAAAEKEFTSAAARWRESLAVQRDEERFFRPDPQLWKRLEDAGTQPQAAADALAGRFSADTLATLVLLRNPEIKAAEHRFRAALDAFPQITHLDEILRQYSAFTEALMTGVGPMKGRDRIDLQFPFPGVLSLKGQVVNQAVKAARESLEIARRNAVTEARVAFRDLIYSLRAQEITRRTLGLLDQLESVANSRYRAGRTSFQDVIKIRIRREVLKEELTTLRRRQDVVEAKIRELVDLRPAAGIGRPAASSPPAGVPPLELLYDAARNRRQELQRLRAQIGKMERMIEMAETMILPDYSLNLSLYDDAAVSKVGSAAVKEAFPVSTEASQAAGLPKMPWYGIDDPYLRQTREELQALRESLDAAEVQTVTLVRTAWFDLDRALRESTLYAEKVVNLSQSALDVSTRAYESGDVAFADVIGSYMSWLEANLTAYRKESDTGIAWAQLEKAVGITLSGGRLPKAVK